jgi:thioesterase domain-containing protein
MARQQQPSYISEAPFSSELLQASVRHNYAAFPSISEKAAPHTALIRATGISGPCVLAGYSYGGILAFEIAHQLKCHGIPVEAVFLFDSDMKMREWEWFKRHLRNTFRLGPNYLWRKIRQRLTADKEKQVERLNARQSPVKPNTALDASNPEAWLVIDRIWRHSLKHYRPRRLASRGILIRAQESCYNEVHNYDGCLGWRHMFAGGLEIIEVPGDHRSMWKEPQLRTLVKVWVKSLEKLRHAQIILILLGFNLLSCGAANGC